MSDIRAIRVLNFIGKKEEQLKWIEKFLTESRRSGIRDTLLDKVTISKTNGKSSIEVSYLTKK
jgi:hypothetical protein